MKLYDIFQIISAFVVGTIIAYGGTMIWSLYYVWTSFDAARPFQYTQDIGMFPLFTFTNQPGVIYQLEFHHGLTIFSLSAGVLFIYLYVVHRNFAKLGKQYRESRQNS